MVALKMVLGETGCGCIIVSGNGPFSSSMNSALSGGARTLNLATMNGALLFLSAAYTTVTDPGK